MGIVAIRYYNVWFYLFAIGIRCGEVFIFIETYRSG